LDHLDDGFFKAETRPIKKMPSSYNALKGALNLNDNFISNLSHWLNRKR